jgi:glutamine amidotransferase
VKKNNIGVIDLGISNINSIINAFKKIKVTATKVSNAKDISAYDKLILPGVGSFDSAMLKIKNDGWFDELNFAVNDKNKKFLGICLGMQLMCNHSEEGDSNGLGWIDASVKKIQRKNFGDVKIPHMGWNNIYPNKINMLLEKNTRFYFVHSYYVDCKFSDNVLAKTKYGNTKFTSSVFSDNVYGVQFHPEKSHKFGFDLLRKFTDL